MRLACVFPVNARCPVTISKSTAPSAKMSARASGSLPSSCSGDMYGTVPTRLPSVVSGPSCVGSALSAEPDGGSLRTGRSLARPKSSSFVPDFVIMTLPGFRSRWTMPWRWATLSASAISIPWRRACSSGSAPLFRRSARVSPSRYSMTR